MRRFLPWAILAALAMAMAMATALGLGLGLAEASVTNATACRSNELGAHVTSGRSEASQPRAAPSLLQGVRNPSSVSEGTANGGEE
jgi:hypothetical protein